MEDRGPSAYAAELLGTLLLVLFIGSILVPPPPGLGVHRLRRHRPRPRVRARHARRGARRHVGRALQPGGHDRARGLRKIKPPDAAIYIVMQLIGGAARRALVKLMLKDEGSGSTTAPTSVNDKFLQRQERSRACSSS